MSDPTRDVDVAILGAGTAGLTARRAAKKEGASVLVIDHGPLGTTCARVGCMPSKLLIAAADAAHHAREAHGLGVRVEGVTIDGPAVFSRVRRERDRFVGAVTEAVDDFAADAELLVGRAQVVGPGRLRVRDPASGATEVRFRALVIATGTTPFVPRPYRGLPLLTSESIFELETLPESLLVVGLGAIGLELGQAFHRLGVRTTMLGIGGGIGPIVDPEVHAAAAQLYGETLDLHPEHTLESVEPDGEGARVRFTGADGRARDARFERVLSAAGRRTTLGGLGLEALGVTPDASGRYPIDEATLQLGELPVFVAGDVNELHPLMHEAADDGRLAGANAARFPEVRAPRRRTPLAIVFADPQIAIVGGGYREACAREAVAGGASFETQGRARIMAENRGLARVYAERRGGHLVGAEVLGPRAEHLGHLLAWAVAKDVTVEEALAMPFYHPVLEEGLRSALYDLAANLRRGPTIRCAVSEVGVGG